MVNSDLVEFKRAYRKFVQEHYPLLGASEQLGRDREYYLAARNLPGGIRFKHNFSDGEVSLVLERKWAEGSAGKSALGNSPEGTWQVQHGAELHLRRSTAKMDPTGKFSEQKPAAKQALDEICKMLLPLANRIAGITKP